MTKEKEQFYGERTVFSTNDTERTRHPHAKIKPIHTPYTFRRINSKWIIDLNVKCKSIELLEYSTGENLGDLGFGDKFLNTTPKAWFTEEKKWTSWTSLKLKCSAL